MFVLYTEEVVLLLSDIFCLSGGLQGMPKIDVKAGNSSKQTTTFIFDTRHWSTIYDPLITKPMLITSFMVSPIYYYISHKD